MYFLLDTLIGSGNRANELEKDTEKQSRIGKRQAYFEMEIPLEKLQRSYSRVDLIDNGEVNAAVKGTNDNACEVNSKSEIPCLSRLFSTPVLLLMQEEHFFHLAHTDVEENVSSNVSYENDGVHNIRLLTVVLLYLTNYVFCLCFFLSLSCLP